MTNAQRQADPRLQQAHHLVQQARQLSEAATSGDQGRIDAAAQQLLSAYDTYSAQAAGATATRDLEAAPAPSEQAILTGVVLDLQTAVVLGRAAQLVGEDGAVGASRDLEAAGPADGASLSEATAALAASLAPLAGAEATRSLEAAPATSPDLPTAKEHFQQQVTHFYAALLVTTTDVIKAAFQEVAQLDAQKIEKSLQTIGESVVQPHKGGFLARAWDAVTRAITNLQGLLGPQNTAEIQGQVTKTLDEVRQGGTALQSFLQYSYGTAAGEKTIGGWLAATTIDIAALDSGTATLVALQQQMDRSLGQLKTAISTIQGVKQPLTSWLGKIGGALPVELLFAAPFLIIIDVSVLRGMDYADTTHVVKMVPGIRDVSRGILQPAAK